MKNCKVCDKDLPESNFHKDSRSKDGFRDKCKNCISEYNKGRFTNLKKICRICLAPKTKKSFTLDSSLCNKCVAHKKTSESDTLFCKVCISEKEKSAFAKRKNYKSGFASICKSCKKEKESVESKYKNNKRQKSYNKKRFFYTRATFILNRTKKLSIPVNYSVKELTILLAKKWKEQKGFCSLTQIKLDRLNCEVDHIVPISKGGTSDISNLRWLFKDVNKMKGDLEESLFYELCFKISKSRF